MMGATGAKDSRHVQAISSLASRRTCATRLAASAPHLLSLFNDPPAKPLPLPPPCCEPPPRPRPACAPRHPSPQPSPCCAPLASRPCARRGARRGTVGGARRRTVGGKNRPQKGPRAHAPPVVSAAPRTIASSTNAAAFCSRGGPALSSALSFQARLGTEARGREGAAGGRPCRRPRRPAGRESFEGPARVLPRRQKLCVKSCAAAPRAQLPVPPQPPLRSGARA